MRISRTSSTRNEQGAPRVQRPIQSWHTFLKSDSEIHKASFASTPYRSDRAKPGGLVGRQCDADRSYQRAALGAAPSKTACPSQPAPALPNHGKNLDCSAGHHGEGDGILRFGTIRPGQAAPVFGAGPTERWIKAPAR